METVLLADRVVEGVNELQQRIHGKPWADYSRVSFLYALRETIKEMGEIAALLRMVGEEFRRQGLTDTPDVNSHANEFSAVLEILKRNRELEERQVEHARSLGNVDALSPNPEMYSSLERQVLQLLLKTRYLVEKLHIYSRHHEGYNPAGSRAAESNVLQLLEGKEHEFQELKAKYDELRGKAIFGRVGEDAAAELERELNEIARRIEAEGMLLREGFGEYARHFERLEAMRARLGSAAGRFEENATRHMGKAFELITMLKKERDYAKKTLMDVEHETVELRSAYTKGLLGLEEEKRSASEAAWERVRSRIRALEKMNAERESMIKRFREIVEDREERVAKLKEELRMLKAKHGSAGKKSAKRRHN